ncbi:excalibur calcium-binding domain-containing protein [Rhodalgimonas zhirmunskyi]|uniref:Excalibur calcium-binding domain-containing protein n=1 Tax=Rhodalgimonas zhirmunskyi TaxID=2964767 RepID=A0AAJ1U9I7_9RHOB|nr:excalibur calcium-binding domain-containing protein [Rhodoalgimonas zhirmunskyi]MDQ2094290.1 excalibur calcium-binding domain-containing protein [Rhodoalgimonas zhirmunskyi]
MEIVMRILLICTFAFATPVLAEQETIPKGFLLAQNYSCGKTCGRVRSCKEAVFQWCACGYSRADGDNDGVPCEKLCGQGTKVNRERVKQYKRELGCR